MFVIEPDKLDIKIHLCDFLFIMHNFMHFAFRQNCGKVSIFGSKFVLSTPIRVFKRIQFKTLHRYYKRIEDMHVVFCGQKIKPFTKLEYILLGHFRHKASL